MSLTTSSCGLAKLVDDVLIEILSLLSARDILNVRQTSWHFETLSRLAQVWHAVLRRDVVAHGLSVPGPARPLAGDDLERRTRRALRLARTWTAPAPAAAHARAFRAGGAVRELRVLPGGRALLVRHDDRLACWDAGDDGGSAGEVRCAGEWRLPCAGCVVVVDTLDQWDAKIAIGPPERCDLPCAILSVHCDKPGNAFTLVGETVCAPGAIVELHGNLLCCDHTRDDIGHIGIELLDWTSPQSGTAILVRPDAAFGAFLGLRFHAGRAVVVWEHCVGLYALPPLPARTGATAYALPATVFALAERVAHPLAFTTCTPRPLPGARAPPHTPPPPLTILAHAADRAGLAHVALTARGGAFAFALVRLPARGARAPAALRVGPSGRGVRADAGGALVRCARAPVLARGGLVDATVDFFPQAPMALPPAAGAALAAGGACPVLDFDDGTGRLVVGGGAVVAVVDFS